MNKKFLRFSRWICLGAIASILLATTLAISLPIIRTQLAFSQQPIKLDENYDVFDLGVVDANSDGNLDLFSVNHSGRQIFALGDGRGKFTNALSQWHLDQDYDISNLEDSLEQPKFDNSGLYIYRQDKALYFHSNQLNSGESISGRLQLSWPVSIEKQENFEAEVKQQQTSQFVASTVEFTATGNGWLVIKSQEDIIEIPHQVEIDSPTPLEKIYLGLNSINPQKRQFDLMWRDRHSMAWTDLNQDGQLDVFIGRGGVKGQLNRIGDRIKDELMIQDGQRFSNQIEQTGIVKKDCPARQSAWVDYNSDKLLDLYIVCGRNNKPFHPNQFWQQQADGKFLDVASQLGLDFPEDGSFRWLDADRDGNIDLLITREKDIELWLNKGDRPSVALRDRFEGQSIVREGKAKIRKIAVADFDRDGDLDAYGSSKYAEEPNLLLVNQNGSFQAVNPTTRGLPETGMNAAWVDYNNDGLTDLQIVPQGIYQQSSGQFKATQLLGMEHNLSQVLDTRGIWFDFNNDGSQDYLSLTKESPSLWSSLQNKLFPSEDANRWQKIWQTNLYQNKKDSNHWLQIELLGSPTNPLGIGTTVEVTTSQGKQLQQVGNTDDSYFSQGHYRLYFGLGKDRQVKAIALKWSDGQTQRLENVKGDRLITIDKNSKIN